MNAPYESLFPPGFDDLMESIIRANPPRQMRTPVLLEISNAASAGQPLPVLEFPRTYSTENRRAKEMHALYVEGNEEALRSYEVPGTNSKSKALRQYQQMLLESLDIRSIMGRQQEAA